jgi:oxygen-independent coproporphyrinogen III oxidase
VPRRAPPGFDNVSLDLMMWLPQQAWRTGARTSRGSSTRPEHASLYLLELYPNAPLKEDMARAGWSLAPDDDAAEMYLWAWSGSSRRATRSTRSRTSRGPGRESRHNLKYWQDGEWLGLGCGAHSTRAASDGKTWRPPRITWRAWRLGPRRRSSAAS